jgi:hypothetical protein
MIDKLPPDIQNNIYGDHQPNGTGRSRPRLAGSPQRR